MKKNPGRKHRRRNQKAFNKYVPGTLGISVVSETIRDEYGAILSRRDRKELVKVGIRFQAVRSY